ncbi:MAG: hypothetical protein HQL52_17385 [Magnetococcales bacterium]|nr:hypothetical protein [Magnetococcales bacterium]
MSTASGSIFPTLGSPTLAAWIMDFFRQLPERFQADKRPILHTSGLFLTLAVLIALIWPPIYAASGSFMLKRSQEGFSTPTLSATRAPLPAISREELDNEVAQITSEQFISIAAQSLLAHQILELPPVTAQQSSYFQRLKQLTGELKQALTIQANPATQAIELTLQWHSKEKAREILARIMGRYIALRQGTPATRSHTPSGHPSLLTPLTPAQAADYPIFPRERLQLPLGILGGAVMGFFLLGFINTVLGRPFGAIDNPARFLGGPVKRLTRSINALALTLPLKQLNTWHPTANHKKSTAPSLLSSLKKGPCQENVETPKISNKWRLSLKVGGKQLVIAVIAVVILPISLLSLGGKLLPSTHTTPEQESQIQTMGSWSLPDRPQTSASDPLIITQAPEQPFSYPMAELLAAAKAPIDPPINAPLEALVQALAMPPQEEIQSPTIRTLDTPPVKSWLTNSYGPKQNDSSSKPLIHGEEVTILDIIPKF